MAKALCKPLRPIQCTLTAVSITSVVEQDGAQALQGNKGVVRPRVSSSLRTSSGTTDDWPITRYPVHTTAGVSGQIS